MTALLSPARRTPVPVRPVEDEAAARRTLRGQVARLEARLARCDLGALPAPPATPGNGPRLLDLAALERSRDDLVERLDLARRAERDLEDERVDARRRLDGLLRDPARHPFAVVTLEDLGLPGCGAYQARPRLGLIGMLMGWWRVKLSSGCP